MMMYAVLALSRDKFADLKPNNAIKEDDLGAMSYDE
jgi:hypothetical protein